MTRFADPTATSTVLLGPCQCPGTPHEQDEAVIRFQLSGSALARIGRAELDGAVRLDPMAAYRQTVLETVESWNLLWPGPPDDQDKRHPVPVPIISSTVEELDVGTLKILAESADALISNEGVLPNGSGAPSRASSRGSASRTRRPTPAHTT